MTDQTFVFKVFDEVYDREILCCGIYRLWRHDCACCHGRRNRRYVQGTLESFVRWVKQNLNVTVLFGTTKNAVFSQLFSALIAYVLLKFLHTEGHKKNNCKRLSFAGFTRQLLCTTLPSNGGLNVLEKELNIQVFLADVYTSWQCGSNEIWTNRVIV